MARRFYGILLAGLMASLWLTGLNAGGLKRSDSVVKVAAKHSPVDAAGNQTVVFTIDIDAGWHIYANPAKHELYANNATVVKVRSKASEAVKLSVNYPAGTTKTDNGDTYQIYDKKVEIRTQVQRVAGDRSPLDFTIRVNSCTGSVCLPQGAIHVVVPAE